MNLPEQEHDDDDDFLKIPNLTFFHGSRAFGMSDGTVLCFQSTFGINQRRAGLQS